MVKSFSFFILLSFIVAFSVTGWAFKVPALSGPLMDEPNLLSANAKYQIEDAIRRLHENNGPQTQVFITSSLQGEEIEQVTIQIFDKWKLGDEKKDNGILFLIAPAEKKMRIEVGQGLEGDLPDVIAKRIIADVVTPYFKRQEYDFGVAQGVAAIAHYINASPEQKAEVKEQVQQNGRGSGILGSILNQHPLLLLFLLISILKIFSFFGGGRGGGGPYYGGSGFGGGGFSGGGWGGGGGSSSGGGASGGW